MEPEGSLGIHKSLQGSSYKTDNTELQQVSSLKYLGSVANIGSTTEEEIKESTATGNKLFYANKKDNVQ
jgi:hypothetical protein